jgi:hypothetical protein
MLEVFIILLFAPGRKEEWQILSHVGYSILSSKIDALGLFLLALLESLICKPQLFQTVMDCMWFQSETSP